MADTAERQARVERLLQGARVLGNPENAAARAVRARLLETTGLSSAGIERALSHALEIRASDAERQALLACTPESPRAHVLLSSNVFVAALRAIAIGLASSASVRVRASRRDPALAEALHALAPDSFELVSDALSPMAGEHFWAYGTDATLAELRASLPRGVWFHAHGAGFAAVVVDAREWTRTDARAIALDAALFDQQGCLSPRVVCVRGTPDQARIVANALADELSALAQELPHGLKTATEQAEARRNRDAAAYAFELFDAGQGWVSCASELVIPPSGRNLHVIDTTDPVTALTPFAAHVTSIAANTRALRDELRSPFAAARVVELGELQRPPLDGPVDRRHGTQGELLT
jgi:hypothetical protein